MWLKFVFSHFVGCVGGKSNAQDLAIALYIALCCLCVVCLGGIRAHPFSSALLSSRGIFLWEGFKMGEDEVKGLVVACMIQGRDVSGVVSYSSFATFFFWGGTSCAGRIAARGD